MSGSGQVVVTVAGKVGEGRPPVLGALRLPVAIAFAPDTKALHIADRALIAGDEEGGRVWKASDGRLILVVGGGEHPDHPTSAGDVRLNYPTGLAVGAQGSVGVADRNTNHAWWVTGNRIDPLPTAEGQGRVTAMALDECGAQYVGDGLGRVWKVVNDETGRRLALVVDLTKSSDGQGKKDPAAPVYGVLAIAFDPAGVLHVSEAGGRVWRVEDGGAASPVPVNNPMTALYGLAFDHDGRLHVGDAGGRGAGVVWRVVEGKPEQVVGGGADVREGAPPLSTMLDTPTGIAFDEHGDLHVAEGPSPARVIKVCPVAVSATAGDRQVALPTEAFKDRVAVRLAHARTQAGVAGVGVVFNVASGSATFTSETAVVTDAEGKAVAPVLTAGPSSGPVVVRAALEASPQITAEARLLVGPAAALQVTAEPPRKASAGAKGRVGWTVSNQGPHPARKVTLTARPQNGAALGEAVEQEAGKPVKNADGSLVWSWESLEPRHTVTAAADVAVPASARGLTVCAQAEATAETLDPATGQPARVGPTPAWVDARKAEVRLPRWGVSPKTVQRGSDVVYTWKIRNLGPDPAEQVSLRITLPEYTTWHLKYENRPSGKTAVVKLKDPLPSMGRGWVSVVATVDDDAPDGASLQALAWVESAIGMPQPGEKVGATAQVSVHDGVKITDEDLNKKDKDDSGQGLLGFLLGLFAWLAGLLSLVQAPSFPTDEGEEEDEEEKKEEKEDMASLSLDGAKAEPAEVTAGEKVTVTLSWTVVNTSEKQDAEWVYCWVTLPPQANVTGAEVDGKTADASGSSPQVGVGTVKKGNGKKTVKVTATVSAPPERTDPLSFQASAYAVSKTFPSPLSTATVKVKAVSELVLKDSKASSEAVAVGDTVTYTWTLDNKGPSLAAKVTVTATPPRKLDQPALAVGDTKGTLGSDGTLTATVVRLDPGKPLTATLTGKVTAATEFTKDSQGALVELKATLKAAAASSQKEPEDTATARGKTTLTAAATLAPSAAGEKLAAGTGLGAGRPAAYVWTVRNTGKVDAVNATLTLPQPAVTAIAVSGSSPKAAEESGALVWRWPSIPAGRAVQAVLAVAVDPAATTLPALTATATADNAPKQEGAATRQDCATPPALRVTGTATPVPALPGQPVTFTWRVANTGPDTATGVKAELGLPKELTNPKTTLVRKGARTPQTGTTVELGALPPQKGSAQEVVEVEVAGTVAPGAFEALSPTATVNADRLPAKLECRDAVAPVAFDARLTLTAVSRQGSPVPAGQAVELVWKVSAAGTSTAAPPILTLDPGPRLRPQSATADGDAVPVGVAKDGLWDVELARAPTPDQPIEVKISALVAPDTPDHSTITVPAWLSDAQRRARTDTEAPLTITATRKATLTATLASGARLVVGKPDNPLSWLVANQGPSQDDKAALAVTLPEELTVTHALVAGVRGEATRSPAAQGKATWTVALPGLPVGAPVVVELVVDAPDAPPPHTKATVSWTAAGATTTTTATGAEPVEVAASPDVKVLAGSVAATSTRAGDGLALAWTLANHGASTARVAKIAVTIRPPGAFTPHGVTGGLVGATPTYTTSEATTTITGVGDITPGTSTTLVLAGAVPDTTTAGTLTATATIDLDGQTSNPPIPQLDITVTA